MPEQIRMSRKPHVLALLASPALAQKQYGPGVTDTEIKIGNTNPYSGNASAYGQNGRAEAAYYRMINDRGGVNGRNDMLMVRALTPSPRVRSIRKSSIAGYKNSSTAFGRR